MPIIIILAIIIINSVKIVPEYERGVIFRLGRLVGARGPGLFFIIPIVDRMVRMSLRTITLDVPIQEVITKDNVPAKVNAVCYFRVMDPAKAVVEVQDYIMATSQIAQTSLRSVVGQADLDELLSQREKINTHLQQIIDLQTDPWGIKVSIVEVKDVQIPEQMQRAIAHQAEAERDRRAKIINAEGEYQAAQKLADAAKIIAEQPIALQLRYMQTAIEIANEKSSTTIFPLPIELLKPFIQMMDKSAPKA
ncbi:MAG TPA: slipin family protein [Elusimicrobiota bacterium]|nr:slipin family protein [Elusimicrobiota bacterium]